MENRRLMLAALLSAMIVITWQVIFPPPPPIDSSSTTPVESPLSPTDDEAPSTVDGSDPSSPALSEPAGSDEASIEAVPAEVPVLEPIVGEAEEMVVITTPLAQVELTTLGAQVRSYRLINQLGEDGEPLDLVRERGKDLYPFSLIDAEGSSPLNTALFTVEQRRADDGRQVVHFRHRSNRGSAEKIFRWDDVGFMDVEVRIEGRDRWGLLFGPGVEVGDSGASTYGGAVGRIVGYRQNGEVEKIAAKKQNEDKVLDASGLDWVTLEDNFFLVAAIPVDGVDEVQVRPVYQRAEVETGRPRFLPLDTASKDDDLEREQMLIVRSEGESMTVRTYLGAKRYSHLANLPYGLEQTVRWGSFIGVLAKPLYLVLGWVQANIVSNYGWAIVLVTFLLKLVFFPLTHSSQKSMTKMQELNPKVQAIRSKYRNKLRDKQGRPNVEAQQQMNQEVMAVYKSAGVNPAAGCLPILIQMPVFFAFFRLLTTAVELRGAEWIAWIHDLSQPDPYYVLPILMGITSLATQRMVPSSPDPMQRRIMQFMPLMFAGFAIYFPSGLVVYWLTNNILTMGQQYLILRSRRSAEAATATS